MKKMLKVFCVVVLTFSLVGAWVSYFPDFGLRRGHHHRRHIPHHPHGCFIASAVYGQYDARVDILRDFRDKYLMTNEPGRAAVDFYYRHSPRIAETIQQHDFLRFAGQALFFPVIGFVYLANET